MKILIASVTNAPPEILRAHIQSVLWQDAQADIDYLYLADPALPNESREILSEAGISVRPTGPKPIEARHEVMDQTHAWSEETFTWLGRERQRLLDHAQSEGFDALWLIDSDLIASPDTLRSLVQTEKDVVSSVFWTRWQEEAPPLPQVWLRHPYELNGKGLETHEFLKDLYDRQLVKVGGLGASTLIRKEVFSKVAYAPLLEGLPDGGMWKGEDRSFCIRAQRNHVDLWADAWSDLFHVYRPADIERIPEQMERLKHRSSISPSDGDLVSALLEPVEEPRLHGWRYPLRGRLGSMKILPALEDTLKGMERGDERFIRVRFPMWWPATELAGSEKALRITLLDLKPFQEHPTLSEFSAPIEYLTESRGRLAG